MRKAILKLVYQKITKIQRFIPRQIMYHWKAHNNCFKGRSFMTSATLGGGGSTKFLHLLTGGGGVSQSLTFC